MTPDEQPQPVASELLPCPFCGEHPMSEQDESGMDVWCYQDHAFIQMTAQEWNTRAHPPASATSQPDAVRVTEDSVTVATIRLAWAKFQANEYSVIANMDFVKAIREALNHPAESSAPVPVNLCVICGKRVPVTDTGHCAREHAKTAPPK